MSCFEFEGKKVRYSETGAGSPLLLLHGNTASSAMFDGVAPMYAGDFNVITMDFLGHGGSDRLPEFPADLWFYEARQVMAFLKEKKYAGANIIGSSSGALVAINVALEAPELVAKVIADSFEGETPLKQFTQGIARDREASKRDKNAQMFYRCMQGDDWEQVVDNDTAAIIRHEREIGRFCHKELSGFEPDILLTGSKKDEFISGVSPTFFEDVYGGMLKKIGHGSMHLFEEGGHPAMLSNMQAFYQLSMRFFKN